MATIPGAQVVASRYGETVVLYSEGNRVEIQGAYGAPPGPDGYCWIVEPGKPKKVPFEVGRIALDHYGYTGVVLVDVTETRDELGNITGTKYDLETAKKQSRVKTERGDELMFKGWLSGAIEDYVKRNKPVPEPPEAIMVIIERRGYDLKKYGIVPIGWAEKAESSEVAALRAELNALKKKLGEK